MTPGATAPAVPDLSTEAPSEGVDGLEYPTRRDEAWRYAPHDLLGRLSFGPPSGSAGEMPDAVSTQIPALDGPLIVIVNGTVDAPRSRLAELPDGVQVTTLAEASTDHAEPVKAHVEPEPVVDAYTALNASFGVDGAFVDVADGHQVDTPVHIVDVIVPGQVTNSSCAGSVLHLGAGSSATIVETRLGGSEAFGGSNSRTTITLGENATLDHIVLQDLASAQVQLSRVDVTQHAQSTLRARSFNLGGAYGRLAYDVHLAGVGAHADLSGLYYGAGEQVLDQQINVIHGAEDCTSRQSYRGVLDDKSTGVFNGGIDVRPGADGTDAEQANDNLLLSDRAEVNTQPRLEILADDVACKHGATVGQLDDNAMYYLRTRGIPAAEARRLLIDAFADQAVEDIAIDAVSTWIRHRLGTADA